VCILEAAVVYLQTNSSRAGEHGVLENIKGWLIYRAAQVIWTQYFLAMG